MDNAHFGLKMVRNQGKTMEKQVFGQRSSSSAISEESSSLISISLKLGYNYNSQCYSVFP